MLKLGPNPLAARHFVATTRHFIAPMRMLLSKTPKGNVKELTDLSGFKDFIKAEKLSVIDFYATWCGPCKAIEPVFAMLSERIPEVQFGRVDVDQAAEVAQEYQITAMPTCLFFKGSEGIDQLVGANPPQLVKLISQHGEVDLSNR